MATRQLAGTPARSPLCCAVRILARSSYPCRTSSGRILYPCVIFCLISWFVRPGYLSRYSLRAAVGAALRRPLEPTLGNERIKFPLYCHSCQTIQTTSGRARVFWRGAGGSHGRRVCTVRA
eukprot:2976447-Pyramimonas_sp.AAC.1